MKKTICLWALLLIVVSCTNDDNYNDEHGDKAVIPPKGRIIRIMTYNIYGARATSPANAADLDALAEVIRRQDPDFVTLNETRSYRLPCAASQPGEDRSLCVIRVEIDGKDLYVASTHLDHLSGDASRLVQANEIRRIRDTELDGDLILAGDLNAIPSSNVIATMTAFLTNVGTIDQYTFPSENPTRKIDYILYAPIGHFGVQNCTVVSRSDQQVDGVDASDHRPVVADIRFQTEEDLPENQE